MVALSATRVALNASSAVMELLEMKTLTLKLERVSSWASRVRGSSSGNAEPARNLVSENAWWAQLA